MAIRTQGEGLTRSVFMFLSLTLWTHKGTKQTVGEGTCWQQSLMTLSAAENWYVLIFLFWAVLLLPTGKLLGWEQA